MRARSALGLLIAAATAGAACGAPRPSRMYPAGTDKDDGYGDLAQLSARLYVGAGSDAAPFAAHHGHRTRVDPDAYGGNAYGGASYGTPADPADPGDATSPDGAPIYSALQVGQASPPPPPHYTPTSGLTGAIEGTVSWHGAPPPAVATACGAIAPGVRVAANRGVAGVLVFIERVDVGRPLPAVGRPATVGGLIAKRGCALAPALQIITPLPAELAIHGDAGDAGDIKLRAVLPGGAVRPFELQPAGRVVMPAQPGVTRVEADDSSLGAAWVVAAATPYYALTDERGRFRLDELAAGSYDLTFWQPPLAAVAGGKLIYGPPVVVHRAIKLDAVHPARLDLTLP